MVDLQCLIGMQCNKFVMLAADQTHTPQSIIVMKDDEHKLHELGDELLLGLVGESGETVQFAQYVAKNLQLYRMRNCYQLSTPAAVHFIRKSLADRLRSGEKPIQMNMILSGFDAEGGSLYTMDWLATCIKVPFAAHGFAGMLSRGILDQYYKETLSEEEAYAILKMCVREIHQRLFFNLPNFHVKVISRGGIHELPSITPRTFLAQG